MTDNSSHNIQTKFCKQITEQELLMYYALSIGKYVHHIYDSGKYKDTKNWYHGHFTGGVNPFYSQTNDCLIIEEYYYIPVSKKSYTIWSLVNMWL